MRGVVLLSINLCLLVSEWLVRKMEGCTLEATRPFRTPCALAFMSGIALSAHPQCNKVPPAGVLAFAWPEGAPGGDSPPCPRE